MKKLVSAGFIPYEIGDFVKLKNKPEKYKIEDIIFTQSVRTATSKFEVILSMEDSDHPRKCNAEMIESIYKPTQQ